MAVTFTSNKPGQPTITIGGNNTDSPFPTYSINREEIYSSDDTYIGTRFTISMNGNVVVDGDPTIGGQLHSATQAEAITKLSINDIFPTLGFGVLNIQPYDSSTPIKFNDAKITSISTPVDESSGGFRYQNYAITFEATTIDDVFGSPLVNEVGESWNLSVNQDQFAYDQHNINGSLYRTYTLTHEISATGRQNPSTSSAVEAWRQAVLWVESRLQNQPDTSAISTHINSIDAGPKFVPFFMNTDQDKDDLKLNAKESNIIWYAYNGSRNINTDISSGSYSVTDTWIIAIKDTPATHSISYEANGGQEESISIVLNGTVSGLNTNQLGSSSSNKNNNYSNAESGYENIKDLIRSFAVAAYSRLNDLATGPNNSTALNIKPIARSVSQNRTDGTITWSETYNDKFMVGDTSKIAEQDISIQHKNKLQDEEVIAIIPVIGREQGPVIQSFQTENIRTTSITVSLVMHKDFKNETVAYDTAKEIADQYEPANSWVNSQSYDYTDDYGLITFNKEWFYK